jgi:predicted homoserine dehydrogenase-like protein
VGPFNRRLVLERADGRKTMAEMAAVLEAAIGGRNGN